MSDHEPTLTVASTRAADAVVITVAGEIDSSNCAELQERLMQVASAPDHGCTLDLSAVSFMDSSGLRALLLGQRAVTEAGKSMVVTNVSESVRRLFEITGLSDRFGLAD